MNRVQQLEKLIKKHKELYYAGKAIISDPEFDELESELRKIDPENYTLSLVGSSTKSTNKMPHDRKMLSLEKTYDLSELEKWMDGRELLSLFKIDGVSCSLIYKEGKLFVAKTRGDGAFGENITDKAMWINDIIKSLPEKVGVSSHIEIRGEIFCTEDNFLKLSKEMENRNLAIPSSQRNIVAGLISRKDSIDLCSFLSFLSFDISGIEGMTLLKENQKLDLLKQIGCHPVEYEKHHSFLSIPDSIKKAQEFIVEGDHQIDGVVFIVNDIETQNTLGNTSHHPRYKMAFKFKGESRAAKIREINWNVSRNGILTPVARVEKVELSGAMVENVTLHNFGLVKQYNLKKDDLILMVRSGEVIPKFLEVVTSAPGEFEYPKECPNCQMATVVDDIRLYCRNKDCPGRNHASILNFVQKIGIEDLSEKRLLEMIKKGQVKKIADLYRLTEIDLLSLDKTKEKLAQKLYKNIQATKKTDLVTFLSALGISGGAYNKCQKIVQAGFNTIQKIRELKEEDLLLIESFAETSSRDFFISLQEKMPIVLDLLEQGMSFSEIALASDLLGQKSFCITGPLSEKREVIEERIRNNGGKVLSAVSKNLDFLVCNDKEASSSKLDKARSLSLKIISENELNEFLSKGVYEN